MQYGISKRKKTPQNPVQTWLRSFKTHCILTNPIQVLHWLIFFSFFFSLSIGDSHNTEKFLQESELCSNVRSEPLCLMSDENQNLQPVRSASLPRRRKSVSWGSDGRVAMTPRAAHSSLPSIHAKQCNTPSYVPIHLSTARTLDPLDLPVKLEKDRKIDSRSKNGMTCDQFASKSSNFTAPGDLNMAGNYWSSKTSYQELHPGDQHFDLGYKNDGRFSWQPGQGTPRPQTRLTKMQDSWSKSDARKVFHKQFPETHPDLRDNERKGRQHEFFDRYINAQVLRGCPVESC